MALLRNVLVFHSGALGDFVLSFPVTLALARLYPTSRVRYVTAGSKGKLAGRVLGVEAVDSESGFSGLFADGAEVPDTVVKMLAGSHRIVSYVAGSGDVWSKRVAELAPGAAIMNLQTVPGRTGVSAMKWICEQCAADKAVGGAVEQIVSLVEKQGLLRRPYGGRGVLIHPGAGAANKCWRLDAFRELALRLKDEHDEIRWVIGEVERERMPSAERRALEALGDVIVPTDYLGLLEELLSARVFVGNDSGPGHLAAMSGVPVVSLFGPTDPAVWSPVGPKVEVVVAPNNDLNTLDIVTVHQAIKHIASQPATA